MPFSLREFLLRENAAMFSLGLYKQFINAKEVCMNNKLKMKEGKISTFPEFCCLLFILFIAALYSGQESYAGQGDDYRGNTGEMYAINVPGFQQRQKLTLHEAKRIVRTHRWINVNASTKDPWEAKTNAEKISNQLGKKPMVLVYFSRFIDAEDRNKYPSSFSSPFRTLLLSGTSDNKQLLVTAKSYAVHQSLRVIRELGSKKILFIGISPAFGAFGNAMSDNVKDHHGDIKNVRSKYCMVASKRDGFTWRRGGAAYKRNSTYRGDPDVGKAKNSNSQNVYIVLLDSADHKLDDYIKYGLKYAMEQCAHHFNMHDTAIGPARINHGNEISMYKINCNNWCDNNKPRCVFCSKKSDCGAGYDDIKKWGGKGINWHACEKRRSRDEATKSNEEACKAWCNANSNCKYCSTNKGCGYKHESMKSWTGYGKNWHACRKR